MHGKAVVTRLRVEVVLSTSATTKELTDIIFRLSLNLVQDDWLRKQQYVEGD